MARGALLRMPGVAQMNRQRRRMAVVLTLGVVLVLAGAGVLVIYRTQGGMVTSHDCARVNGSIPSVRDLGGVLGNTFSQGAIQAFGSNSTTVILGGLSFYHKDAVPSDSEPAALAMSVDGDAPGENLTSLLGGYFKDGGIFPVVWNGTWWFIGGQATTNGLAHGAAVFLQGKKVNNVTALVAPYFSANAPAEDVGIWIAGWDGTGWLVGGNASWGASLIYLQDNRVTNLSGMLSGNAAGDWVQMVAWNGTGWLIGGKGVFAAWNGGRFTNLNKVFGSGGVYAMGWNGREWLAGGTPSKLIYVNGTSLSEGPALFPGFSAWVNTIVADGNDWVVGGGGYTSNGMYSPELSVIVGTATGPQVVDISSCLPPSFQGGWIQFGGDVESSKPSTILLTGEGNVNPASLAGVGAAGMLVLP